MLFPHLYGPLPVDAVMTTTVYRTRRPGTVRAVGRHAVGVERSSAAGAARDMLVSVSGAAQNRQGAATRLRLVKAAERLFAAHGVDAVSVRAVNAAAGLGAASVHYHFGSKDDLLRAVLTDVGAPVRDEIAANVAVLAADPVAPSPDALVRAVTEPYLKLLLRHRVRGMRWIKIIAQISQENNPVLLDTEQRLPDELFAQVQRAFPIRIRRAWNCGGPSRS